MQTSGNGSYGRVRASMAWYLFHTKPSVTTTIETEMISFFDDIFITGCTGSGQNDTQGKPATFQWSTATNKMPWIEVQKRQHTKAITHIIMKIGKPFFHMVPVFGEAKKISTVSFHLSSRKKRSTDAPPPSLPIVSNPSCWLAITLKSLIWDAPNPQT